MNLPTELQEVLTAHGWSTRGLIWRTDKTHKVHSTTIEHPALPVISALVVVNKNGSAISLSERRRLFSRQEVKPLALRVGTRNWKGRICAWMTARVFEAEEAKREEERREQAAREHERKRNAAIDQLAEKYNLTRSQLDQLVKHYQSISGDITWYVDRISP